MSNPSAETCKSGLCSFTLPENFCYFFKILTLFQIIVISTSFFPLKLDDFLVASGDSSWGGKPRSCSRSGTSPKVENSSGSEGGSRCVVPLRLPEEAPTLWGRPPAAPAPALPVIAALRSREHLKAAARGAEIIPRRSVGSFLLPVLHQALICLAKVCFSFRGFKLISQKALFNQI